MYCIYCGTELPDGAVFCPKCGQRIADTDQQSQHQERAVSNVDRVIDIGKSPVTLAFTIAFSAQILLSLIESNFSFFNVTALILEVVICVGCWIVYGNSCQHLLSPAGFSVLRIGVPIYLVFSVLEMFVSAVVDAVVYENIIMELAMMIGYLIVVVFRIWCYFKLCVITNHGYKIMNGEPAEWNVSTPCLVIMMILTVLGVIGETAEFGDYSNAAATLSYLADIVTSVLAVVILFQIRQKQQ